MTATMRAWVTALRPKTLVIGVVAVGVGTSLAAHMGSMQAAPAAAALAGALLLQVASNFANDLFDFRKGADGPDRLGPTRVVAAGLLTEKQITVGLVLVLAAALAVGFYLASISSGVVLAIGIAGMVSAVAYTGGPYPLGYHGLGDVFVFLFFGLAAVAGTVFVQTGTWEPVALAVGVPMGLLAAAVLTVNNIRDIETDANVGKRTLPVRLGRSGAAAYYGLLLAVPYGVVAALVAAGELPRPALAVLVSAPLAFKLHGIVRTRRDGPALNKALGMTAGLLTLFGTLLGVGTCVG